MLQFNHLFMGTRIEHGHYGTDSLYESLLGIINFVKNRKKARNISKVILLPISFT